MLRACCEKELYKSLNFFSNTFSTAILTRCILESLDTKTQEAYSFIPCGLLIWCVAVEYNGC